MPAYVLTQELLDDLYALLAEGRKLRAEVNYLQSNREPKPRDVWAQITSATTQSVTIGGTSVSGYYPATWHYRDEEGQAWSDGVTCWLKDANDVALVTGLYYRAYLTSGDDSGIAIFYVDRDGNDAESTTAVTISTGQDNYDVPTDVLAVNPSSSFAFTGFAAPSSGSRVIEIINTGSNTISFTSESGSSTAANRIYNPNGYQLTARQSGYIIYDTVNLRWDVVFPPNTGTSGSGTATYVPVWSAASVLTDSIITATPSEVQTTVDDAAFTPVFGLRRAKGAGANLANGDRIFSLIYYGRAAGVYNQCVDIRGIYQGNGTTTPADLVFYTNTGAGLVEALRIKSTSALNLTQLTASKFLRLDSSKDIQTSGAAALDDVTTITATVADAATNTVTTIATWSHTTSGTAANEFGIAHDFYLEDGGGNLDQAGQINFHWANLASDHTDFHVKVRRSGSIVQGLHISGADGQLSIYDSAGNAATFDPTALTADRVFTIPDGAGEILVAGVNARERLSAARTYYVRTDGSDSNTGLADSAGGAFLTIQKAIDVVAALDLSIYDVTIQVRSGTFTGAILVDAPFVGAGSVTLQGDTTTPSNVVLSVAGNVLTVQNYAVLYVKGFKLTSSAGDQGLIYCKDGATVHVNGKMEYGAANTFHIYCFLNGSVNITADYTINGNSQGGFIADRKSSIAYAGSITATMSGTPTFAAGAGNHIGSTNVSLVSGLGGVTFSGGASGKRYNVTTNSVIDTNGGGATYIPGDAAGTTATGGQYV